MSRTPAPTSTDAPPAIRAAGVRLVRAAPSLWRVVDATGRVLGHLERSERPGAHPFRARRFRAASRAFVDVGGFWSADDAVEVLRTGR